MTGNFLPMSLDSTPQVPEQRAAGSHILKMRRNDALCRRTKGDFVSWTDA